MRKFIHSITVYGTAPPTTWVTRVILKKKNNAAELTIASSSIAFVMSTSDENEGVLLGENESVLTTESERVLPSEGKLLKNEKQKTKSKRKR